MNAQDIWTATLGELKNQMTQATYDTSFANSHLLRNEQDHYVVGVPTSLVKERLESFLKPTVERTIQAVTQNGPCTVEFCVLDRESGWPRDDHEATQALKAAMKARKVQTPSPPPVPEPPPEDARLQLEFISSDPKERAGWQKVGHYHIWFWQPYLNAKAADLGERGARPFDLWLCLLSWQERKKINTVDIATVADMYANGNKHRVIGRAKSGGGRQLGDLELLAMEGIVHYTAQGSTRNREYLVTTHDSSLPLLTPAQLQYLPDLLQKEHEALISSWRVDVEKWRSLTARSLLEAAEI